MLLILLAAGLGLRVVTQLAYRPAIFYIDSYKYLRGSGGYDPVGYNLLLKPSPGTTKEPSRPASHPH